MRRSIWAFQNFFILLLCAPLLLMVGCSSDPEASQEAYDKALAALDSGDSDGAIVQFKTVLQMDPENTQARWRLGQLYLRIGDPQSALKELEKAAEQGLDEARLPETTVRARLGTGDYQSIVETLGPVQSSLDPTMKALFGLAELGSGNGDAAEEVFDAVLTVDPDNPDALIGRAMLARDAGNRGAALALADLIVEKYPERTAAWLLKSTLHTAAGEHPKAVEAARRLAEIRANSRAAITLLAQALVDNDELDAAETELKKLGTASGASEYVAAQIALARNEEEVARARLTSSLQLEPGHPGAATLLGLLQHRRGEVNQAISHYQTALKSEPEQPFLYRALAAGFANIGDLGSAIDTMERGFPYNNNEPFYIRVLSGFELQSGNAEKALEYAKLAARVSAEDKDKAEAASQIGFIHAAMGEFDAALAAYENRQTIEPSVNTDVEIVRTLLSAGELDLARQRLTQLLDTDPKNPQFHWLRGAIARQTGDLDLAREAFEAALALDPDYPPALEGLAQTYIAQTDYVRAREILDLIVEHHKPNWETALLNIAAIDLAEGRVGEARARYRRLTEESPADARAFAQLGKLALSQNDYQAALVLGETARDLDPRLSAAHSVLAFTNFKLGRYSEAHRAADLSLRLAGERDAGLVQVLARSRWALGAREEAIQILRYDLDFFPENVALRMQLAALLRETGEFDAAREQLDAAAALQPGAAGVLVEAAKLDRAAGDSDTARNRLEEVLASEPARPQALELMASLELESGNYVIAETLYVRAMEVGGTSELAIKLFDIRKADGKIDEAFAGLEDWLRTHPDDRRVRFTLAAQLQSAQRYDEARRHYEQLIKIDSSIAMVHNNLALLHLERGLLDEAKSAAETASELRPKSSVVKDTLGWVAASSGDLEKARNIYQNLLAESPNFHSARYHFAVVLAKLGDLDGAQDELDRVLASGADFPERTRAEAMREEL